MRILLTGASGFIGGALLQALHERGHHVVCASRSQPALPHQEWRRINFAEATQPAHWQPLLSGIDVVINAVGILRERGGQRFEALHTRAPIALFDACAAAGVRQVLQVSALGADEAAQTRYHLSKRAADRHLLSLPLTATVLQPSVVFGPGGGSTRLFMALASMPVLGLPAGGRQPLQPVHLDDVVAAVLALLESPQRAAGRVLPLVGPEALTLRAYLQALRRLMGLPPAPALPLPATAMKLAARIGDRLPSALLDSDSWQMLERGNTAPPQPMQAVLGRPPRGVAAFMPPALREAARAQAVLGWAQPLLRCALALVWLATAAVSFGLYPVHESYALLARVGAPAAWQPLLLYGAAGLDALFGVLTLAPLRPRARRWLWLSQAVLIVGYSALISWRLPEFWLHPYGPLTKNLPMLALLLLLYALEPEEPRR
jgi:uncharacterized protein YbjT (DUF2867 family)